VLVVYGPIFDRLLVIAGAAYLAEKKKELAAMLA